MRHDALYRTLVPDAPLHLHTEVDAPLPPDIGRRAAAVKEFAPGLESPSLVSSYEGSIERVLFCFPSWAASDPELVGGYTSVIGALRVGTKFIAVHNASVRKAVARWFVDAGHPLENVELVPLPDFVAVTDWAEDAYVSLKDATDGTGYLMEPWSFARFGDALIADAVEEHTDIRASSAPLIFQGGNCLIGDDFWFLGKDYFADTVAFLSDDQSPVTVAPGKQPAAFATELFSTYVDARRRLRQIGTKKPIPLQDYVGTRDGDDYYLDIATGGTGTFQPIFHIDMLLTLVGPATVDGDFRVLVGSPTLADELLGTSSPFALADVYDGIARDLERSGFEVTRNPLVHRATLGQELSLAQLKELSRQPDGSALVPAVAQLTRSGAVDTTMVTVRDWHHITWNNCLVENSEAEGRHVYLPTFGHGDNADLARVDVAMEALWSDLGFTPHLLGDFNGFARRLGVVHCIKKYVTRGG